MATQSGAVGHDDVIPQDAVMGDMGICHDEIPVSNLRYAPAVLCAPVYRYILHNSRVVADNDLCVFPFVGDILGCSSERSEGADGTIFTDSRSTLYDNMTDESRAPGNSNGAVNCAIRPYLNTFIYLCFVPYDSGGMYHCITPY